ncbi:hypothetical protein [Blastomonas sp. CCH5-A3]|jgi:hypothetical protein|uniref:hypothetical protein n=1 Tax=Blastomonas sp. CCH5-A3 TaxID=1768761 RepID=UPI0012E35A7E|nr:hypothetical protein [Blastomonas sp. CCH5-A3]
MLRTSFQFETAAILAPRHEGQVPDRPTLLLLGDDQCDVRFRKYARSGRMDEIEAQSGDHMPTIGG